ncbi:MAG: autotransporter domain-containing protein [Puniceicoccales bacterium]|nr:autotransporter domain-containing protein [Puniceicoccales bacterium]
MKDGLLVIGGTRSLPDGASVYLGDTQTSGALQLNGKSVRLSSLRASETGLDNRIVNGFFTEQTPYAVLTLNVATTSEYSGTLGDSNSLRVAYNTFDLIKEGAGVLTLSGAAYNTGDIVVRTGTLRLGGVVLGDGSKRLLAQTASPFIFLNPDTTANAKFDVRELGDEGYSINSGFSLIAGNQDNVADLEGNFRLNGGTLWIGGTREIKYTTTGGGNVRSGTAIADNADTTLIINGTLYSQAGKTSVINYSFSSLAASGSDLLNVTRLELNGIVNITPYVDPKFPAGFRLEAGSYGIINYGSVYADGVRQLRFGWQDPRYNVTFRNAATEKVIYMDVARRLDTNALYWTGDPGTQWGDPSVSGTNFIQEGVGHTSFASGDRAYFTDSVTDPSKRIVNVSAAGVILGEAIFENSIGYDYVLTGGVIGGEAGVLSKTGSGVLTIRNANTYGGGTVLEAGRLIVANNSALGVGTIFLNGGTLSGEGAHSFVNALLVQGTATLDTSSGTLAFGGTVSGAGTLVKTGNGTLQLNGSGSEFTGTIQVNSNTSASSILALGADTDFSSGEFVLSNGAVITGSFANDAGESGDIALGSLSGDGILRSTTAGEKHFIIGARDNVATATALFTGRVEDGPAGTVALTKVGAGTLILAGDNTYSGDTIVNAGVLQIGNGAFTNTVHGNVFIAQEGTLRFNGALTGTLLFPQDISGTGVFEKAGGNTLTLPNDLYGFTGTFRISDGVLQVGAGNAGGALNAEAKIENNGVLLLNRSGDYTLANDVSGTGEIRKSGSGRIVYIGDNTSTGVTSIQNGVFAIGDGSDAKDQQFNSSQIRLDHTRLELNPGSGSTLYLSGGVFGPGSGDPSIAIVKLGDGTAILAGDSEPGGEVSLIRGTLQIGNGGTSGSLENAPIRVADDTTLRFKRAGTSFVKGRITSTGRIEVQGSGTVVLTANNDIQGHVYIEDSATLQLGDGALPTGAFNNSTLQAVNVHLTSPNAVLAFNRKGTDLTTGSTVTLDGPGSFVKLGSGAVTFNSIGNHEGGTIAAEGRLIIPTANIPQNSYLEARDNGILQLSNGAIPFTFEKSFRGTGIIELGSDGTVAGNARTIYNYVEPRDGVTADLRILQVGTNTNFNLGSDPNAIVRARNLLILSGGLLTGTGRVTGTLINSVGAEVRPGGDVGGNIYLNGDFINEGVLNIKLQYDYNTGKIITDTIHYAGSADFKSGATLFVNVDALNGRLPETGERLEIFVDDDPENNPLGASMQGSILQTNAALYGKAFAYNNGHGVSLLFAHSLRDLPGLSLHAGLNDFVGYLDGILNNSGDQQNLESLSALGALLGASNQGAAINNASPLALASLTALPITAAREAARTTHAHLEGLRYDRRYAAEALDIAPYFTATGTFARNADGRSDPTFDSRNYGGLVGVDHAFSKDFIAGANAGYNIGKADFHNGGGKLDADSILFSLYGTYMISSWWYVDAQVFGGYNSYKVTHNSIGGTASAKPSGYDGGANAYFGSVIPLSPFVHFTPYAGFEFVHAEVGSFTEKGKNVVTALRVNSFSQDSLRAVIGTGLNWIVPVSATARLRLGLSLAYSLEVLDSDVDISARFANDKGTGTFKTKAPATPEHGIQVGPVVELTFGGNKAFSLGYTLEHDFSAQTIHHLNASFRVRF